jgi:hypothetical protein
MRFNESKSGVVKSTVCNLLNGVVPLLEKREVSLSFVAAIRDLLEPYSKGNGMRPSVKSEIKRSDLYGWYLSQRTWQMR